MAHVLQFLKMPETVSKVDDFSDYRANMTYHVEALRNLGLTIDEFFTIILFSKLPPNTKEVFRNDLQDDWLNYQEYEKRVTKEF